MAFSGTRTTMRRCWPSGRKNACTVTSFGILCATAKCGTINEHASAAKTRRTAAILSDASYRIIDNQTIDKTSAGCNRISTDRQVFRPTRRLLTMKINLRAAAAFIGTLAILAAGSVMLGKRTYDKGGTVMAPRFEVDP